MKFYGIAIFVFAILLGDARSVLACSCAGTISAKVELAKKHAVFAGQVTKIEKLDGGLLSVTLDVATVWKGVATKEVVVQTMGDEEACGFHFELGKSYLVYAYLTGDEGAKDRRLATNRCTRTRLLDDRAMLDVAELGPPDKRMLVP